jgi:hypothetical protein
VAGTSRRLAPEEVEAWLRAQFGDDITDFSEQHGSPDTVVPASERAADVE